MQNLILIGGGGHCESCIDVIEKENKYKIIGILDVKEKIGQNVFGYDIIGCDDDIEKYINNGVSFLITVGQIKSANTRIKLFEKIKSKGGQLATIISPRAYVSKYTSIGEGTIIMHDAFVNANAKIANNCIINTKAIIEHDVTVESHCHISTGAIVNGGCIISQGAFIGSNATIVQGLKVESNAFIKASSIYTGKLVNNIRNNPKEQNNASIWLRGGVVANIKKQKIKYLPLKYYKTSAA